VKIEAIQKNECSDIEESGRKMGSNRVLVESISNIKPSLLLKKKPEQVPASTLFIPSLQ